MELLIYSEAVLDLLTNHSE